jgi:NitT/TauT family transport system substrate-binding protein
VTRGRLGQRFGAAVLAALALLLVFCSHPSQAADTIKIGLLKTAGNAAIFVAMEHGYFAAENLTPTLTFLDAAQALAVATVSGDIDFGSTALGASLYNLASQGALRVIAGQSADVPTFQNNTVIVSNRAYDAGLKTFRDLKGKSVAITTAGSSPQYSIVLLSEKYGFGLDTIRFLPLQTISNIASAVAGGQGDAGVTSASAMLPIVQRGEAHLLGFVGDETPFQLGAIFIATKTADARSDIVNRFLHAYRRGAREFHDAVTGPGEKRQDNPATPAMIDILAKYLGQTPEQIKPAISYVDGDGRLDAKDVQHQIDWYRGQGLVKGELKASDLIDSRYALLLPAR